ncbi:MAG: DNA starvation/stationary phase protection protein Dps [Flavobacteriales bacterium]
MARKTTKTANLKLNTTRIDLSSDKRKRTVALLQQQLADTMDLYSQTKQAHWTVSGPHFIALHEMFDKFASELLLHVDEIAERAMALGGHVQGTLRMAAASTRLPEWKANDRSGGMVVVAMLADRFGLVCSSTREAIDKADDLGDADTADLFTGISRQLDQSLWFLEAHLRG